MNRTISFEISGLLGIFRHRFSLQPNQPFIILHGPNGVGKTHALEIFERTARKDVASLLFSPFSNLKIEVSGAGSLSVVRTVPEDQSAGQAPRAELVFELDGGPAPLARHLFSYSQEELLRDLVSRNPFLRVEPGGAIIDRRSDEYLAPEEALRLYGATSYRASRQLMPRAATKRPISFEFPPEFEVFFEQISVHLIETQRLLYRKREDDFRSKPATQVVAAEVRTIDIFSIQLAEQISQALAENSRISQKLDRSFPSRVLRLSEDIKLETMKDEQVRDTFKQQAQLRERLTAVSVGDSIDDLPLPERGLEDWERSVMTLYLQDSREKLETFEPLLLKLELLKSIIDSKFLYKTLQFDVSRGFFFRSSVGEEFGPAALSSGEQHELVLNYDLIFNVKRGTLVLIDEPEISLHVSWQKQFLDDLERIAELAGVQFVIATHSPQIVGKYRELMVALGPDSDSK